MADTAPAAPTGDGVGDGSQPLVDNMPLGSQPLIWPSSQGNGFDAASLGALPPSWPGGPMGLGLSQDANLAFLGSQGLGLGSLDAGLGFPGTLSQGAAGMASAPSGAGFPSGPANMGSNFTVSFVQQEKQQNKPVHHSLLKPEHRNSRAARRGPMDEMRQLVRILVKLMPDSARYLAVSDEGGGGNRVSEDQIRDYLKFTLGTGSNSPDGPPQPDWGLQNGWGHYLAQLFTWAINPRGCPNPKTINREDAMRCARRLPGRSWECVEEELRIMGLYPNAWALPLNKPQIDSVQNDPQAAAAASAVASAATAMAAVAARAAPPAAVLPLTAALPATGVPLSVSGSLTPRPAGTPGAALLAAATAADATPPPATGTATGAAPSMAGTTAADGPSPAQAGSKRAAEDAPGTMAADGTAAGAGPGSTAAAALAAAAAQAQAHGQVPLPGLPGLPPLHPGMAMAGMAGMGPLMGQQGMGMAAYGGVVGPMGGVAGMGVGGGMQVQIAPAGGGGGGGGGWPSSKRRRKGSLPMDISDHNELELWHLALKVVQEALKKSGNTPAEYMGDLLTCRDMVRHLVNKNNHVQLMVTPSTDRALVQAQVAALTGAAAAAAAGVRPPGMYGMGDQQAAAVAAAAAAGMGAPFGYGGGGAGMSGLHPGLAQAAMLQAMQQQQQQHNHASLTALPVSAAAAAAGGGLAGASSTPNAAAAAAATLSAGHCPGSAGGAVVKPQAVRHGIKDMTASSTASGSSGGQAHSQQQGLHQVHSGKGEGGDAGVKVGKGGSGFKRWEASGGDLHHMAGAAGGVGGADGKYSLMALAQAAAESITPHDSGDEGSDGPEEHAHEHEHEHEHGGEGEEEQGDKGMEEREDVNEEEEEGAEAREEEGPSGSGSRGAGGRASSRGAGKGRGSGKGGAAVRHGAPPHLPPLSSTPNLPPLSAATAANN